MYLIRNEAGAVIYVGKAKNLRFRLGHYRVANPERLSRRELRIRHQGAAIEIRTCSTEVDALELEGDLIRSLRPRHNRAGVWPGTPGWVVWTAGDGWIELTVVDVCPRSGLGPFRGGAVSVLRSLARWLWWVLHPESGCLKMPLAGWAEVTDGGLRVVAGNAPLVAPVRIAESLDRWAGGSAEATDVGLREWTPPLGSAFERAVWDAEVETVRELLARRGLAARGAAVAEGG